MNAHFSSRLVLSTRTARNREAQQVQRRTGGESERRQREERKLMPKATCSQAVVSMPRMHFLHFLDAVAHRNVDQQSLGAASVCSAPVSNTGEHFRTLCHLHLQHYSMEPWSYSKVWGVKCLTSQCIRVVLGNERSGYRPWKPAPTPMHPQMQQLHA